MIGDNDSYRLVVMANIKTLVPTCLCVPARVPLDRLQGCFPDRNLAHVR